MREKITLEEVIQDMQNTVIERDAYRDLQRAYTALINLPDQSLEKIAMYRLRIMKAKQDEEGCEELLEILREEERKLR